jgi:hypothetical protein
VPAGLAAAPQGNGTVKLSWGPSTSSAGGTMRYSLFRNGAWLGFKTTALSYTDTKPGTGNVSYQVRAIDSAGRKSALSPSVSVQLSSGGDDLLVDTTAPSAAHGFTATPLGYRRVALSWSAATDNRPGTITYELFRGNRRIATLTGTSYTDRPKRAKTHTYWLRAVDAAGNKGPYTSVRGAAIRGALN